MENFLVLKPSIPSVLHSEKIHRYLFIISRENQPRAIQPVGAVCERENMDSESQIALLLAQVDAGMREQENTVENFELAVSHAEQCLGEIETFAGNDSLRSESDLQPLTRALQASQDAATLV